MTVKGSWNRVRNSKAYQDNWEQIFGKKSGRNSNARDRRKQTILYPLNDIDKSDKPEAHPQTYQEILT